MRKLILLFAAGFLVAAFALPAFADSTPATTHHHRHDNHHATPVVTTPVTTTPATTTANTRPRRRRRAPIAARRHLHWLAGTVTSVGTDSLTVGVLWTGPNDGSYNGQTLTVSVVTQTRINEGPHRTPIALGQIQPNDLVSLRAAGDSATSLTAARIHVYCNCHWVGGTISGVGTSSFTVQVSRTGPYDTVLNGQNVTIQVNSNTVYLRGRHRGRIALSDLQTGEGVGVVFSADGFFRAPGFNPATATFTAKRVHVWPKRQVPPASTDASASAQTAVLARTAMPLDQVEPDFAGSTVGARPRRDRQAIQASPRTATWRPG